MDDEQRQPWLHDLVLALAAPTQVWSGADGQIRPGGAAGAYHGDRRVLDRLEVRVDGREPTPVAHHERGGDHQVFVAVPRQLGDPGPDPTVRLTRRRIVEPGMLREVLTLNSTAQAPVTAELTVRVSADRAPLHVVKDGGAGRRRAPEGVGGSALTWADDVGRAVLRAPAATTALDDEDGDVVVVSWPLRVTPGGSESRELLLLLEADSPVVAPTRPPGWPAVEVASGDSRLAPVVERCLDDLRLLRLSARGEEFAAAGAPWFLTLFGRDSLWTARMLLPVTTSLAASTLRLLASWQGVRDDPSTGEEPGKILHELRSDGFALRHPDGVTRSLPPVYYGTIDATSLWALTLDDARRWGLPAEEVEPLLPALERALTWQVEHGDADGDHLLEYLDKSGRGLANQGWKDSWDAVRSRDGSSVPAPIALAEVQAYAYAAAVRGADLLEEFGYGGTDRWRTWAARLREEFDRRYWVDDADGAYPAIALDGAKRPVATLTSNIGHLLGTGILDEEGVDRVARRLTSPELLSGFGVRTLARSATGYSPTGYHVGSVWTHDTAICLAGLAAEHRPETLEVAEALLAALHAFGGRPPELFSGDASTEHPTPVPYPAACRPQAWASAAGVALLTSVLGLRPGSPPTATPVAGWPFGDTVVRLGDLTVTVDAAGSAGVT